MKDLKAFTPGLTIDWQNMINDQLLKTAKVTEDDDILLYSSSSLKSLVLALEKVDKGFDFDFKKFLTIKISEKLSLTGSWLRLLS